MAAPAKFKIGYRVRVKHGIRNTDYPDMSLGGWTRLSLDEALDFSIVSGIVELCWQRGNRSSC